MFPEIPRIVMAGQHPIPGILRHAIPAIAGPLPEIGVESIRNDRFDEPVDVQQLVQDRAGLVGDVRRRGAGAGAGQCGRVVEELRAEDEVGFSQAGEPKRCGCGAVAAGAGAALGVAAEVDAGGVGGCVPVFLELEVSWRME